MSLAEVNKVFSLDRVRSASRSFTFLPQVLEFLAVFLVFPQTVFYSAVFSCAERTSERIVEQTVFPSRKERISERIVVVVFTVFLLFRALQWIFQFLLETLMKGFFALFPGSKKVRRLVLPPGRNWPRTRAHPRRALMAL